MYRYILVSISSQFYWGFFFIFCSPKPTDEAFENELQMALALSQSETQDVQVEVPLVDGDKENTLQAGGDNEKSNEEGNISSDSINQDNQETPTLCKPCKE